MNETISSQVVLKMSSISKEFIGVTALDHVDLELHRGEVLILVGENGAGKSTLMKILAGVYQKDSGEIEINGQPVEIRNPAHAKELGISIVFQEQALIPDLDAIENVFIGREITSGGDSYFGILNRRVMKQKAEAYFDAFATHIDPTIPVRELRLGQRQIVEIIRALAQNASILVLDEPTSALEDFERKQLFEFINKLRQTGVAIVYVSHHLEECLMIGDRLMVLRDGRKVGDMDIEAASIDKIIQLMVGRSLTEQYPKEDVAISEKPVLRAHGLTHQRAFADVSFEVHRGEILGIGGLSGSGKSELARALFGAERLQGGTLEIEGRLLSTHLGPEEAIRQGIAFLPADRKSEGLFLDQDIRYNITISNLTDVIEGWIRTGTENGVARDYVSSLSIKTPSIYQTARNLSGGNQQKVMLARWLFTKPKVLVFEEPTRGIDVNAKVEVYKLISQFVKQGGAVILVSSELPELEGICDRVLVMHNGRITADLSREQLSQETIAYYCVQSVGEGPDGSK